MIGADLTVTHPLIAIPSALAALLVAWQVIWKRGIVPFFRFIRRIVVMLDRINEEFRPNGGDSLRDAVDSKASREEVQRVENGVLEAIRIGNENTGTLHEFGEHLKYITWHEERPEVMARLKLIEDKQEAVRIAIMDALRPVAGADGAFGSLVQQVIVALEHQPSAEKVD